MLLLMLYVPIGAKFQCGTASLDDAFCAMVNEPGLSALHCRAARVLLGWTQGELATAAGVGRMTVLRFERGESVRGAQAAALMRTLTDSGVLLLRPGSSCDGTAVTVGVALVRDRGADQD